MNLKGACHLTNCCVERSDKRPFCFSINWKHRTFFVTAGDESEMQEWMEVIGSIPYSASMRENREEETDIVATE